MTPKKIRERAVVDTRVIPLPHGFIFETVAQLTFAASIRHTDCDCLNSVADSARNALANNIFREMRSEIEPLLINILRSSPSRETYEAVQKIKSVLY